MGFQTCRLTLKKENIYQIQLGYLYSYHIMI